MTPNACILRVIGVSGIAFLTLGASVENLVKYLFGPGFFWIIGGTTLAAFWAYESYCKEDLET
jgi:hypothetical protein